MTPRIGVLGTGALGSRHARALADLAREPGAGLSLAGVFDLQADRARAVAGECGTRAFGDASELFGASDGIVIAVPTVAHAKTAGAALAGGCHVLIEKPIADAPEAADQVLAAAKKADRLVFVGHSERFNGAVRAAFSHLTRARYIEARRVAGFTPRATDVDVVLDLMIHDIDLVLALIGELPSRTEAIGVAVLTRSEDLANVRLEFPSGAVANLTASRVSPDRMRKIRVFGDHSYVSMDCLAGTAEVVLADPERLSQAAETYAAHAAHAAGALAAPPSTLPDWSLLVNRKTLEAPPGQPLSLELLAFAAAIAGERAPRTALPLASGIEGRSALAVACEVRDAMRERSSRWSS